jgi:tetratricopeptide (TPR) repeat protein
MLLASCSMKVLSHPLGLGDHHEAARAEAPAPASAPSGSFQEAREQMTAQPQEPYWPYRMAELYLHADSLAKAEAALQAALTRNPGYAPALALLSKLYYESARYEQGARLLEAARSEPGRFPEGFPPELSAALALHEEALGRPDLAAQAMASVPKSRAGSVGVFVTMRGDSPDSATAAATALVRDHPKSAINQNNYGIARLRAGDPAEASKAFQRAIEIDPALPGPYYNLAILEKYYRLDDAAAERWFHQYRERATDDPDGLAQVFDRAPAKPMAEKKD